jgi:hypothetical protein
MNLFKKILFSAILGSLAFSCVTTQKGTPIAPVNLQVNIDYSQLEYVGEVTGKSTQSYLFGAIPVGGRRFTSGVLSSQFGGIAVPNNRGISNALYDALKQKPDADFILPVAYESVRYSMFFGNKTEYTVRAKVFRLKVK